MTTLIATSASTTTNVTSAILSTLTTIIPAQHQHQQQCQPDHKITLTTLSDSTATKVFYVSLGSI